MLSIYMYLSHLPPIFFFFPKTESLFLCATLDLQPDQDINVPVILQSAIERTWAIDSEDLDSKPCSTH